MSKQKSEQKPSKAEAVQQTAASHPQAEAAEIARLASELCGEEVDAAFVSSLKSGERSKPAKTKGAAKSAPAASGAGGNNYAALEAAFGVVKHKEAVLELLEQCSSIDEAKAAIEAAERILAKIQANQ